jgi:signal transduction histidine kinase
LSKLIQNPTATSTATNQNSNNSLAGIHKTDHYTGSNILFDTYTYDDGFLGKGVNHDGLCEAKDGSIWICADDRVTVFYPDKIDIDTSAPKIELTGIQLFNQNIPWVSLNDNKDSTLILDNSIKVTGFSFDNLSKWNYLPQNLSLAYNNNHITFNYVGVTMYQPKKVKYQFLLEGFDKVWSVATSRTEASYGNLPQGHYTFKVRAVNSQGKWSEEVYYTFTIRPPWWFTWWAYFFYALLLCVALWRFDHYRRKRIIDRERAKTLEREWAQAQQIEKSFNELKATQAQLIQKEKMASLGELTAGIAHEIQNPLNFVNNFSETNAELIEEAQTELKAGNHEEVDAILMDIKGNEEKINYHGKRADSIVKGMLEHSRSSKGERQATEINALCDEYLRLSYHGFRAKYKSFNATIQTHFDEGIGKTSIVPQEIGRVLLNLFNNAFWAVGEKKKVASDGYVPTVTVMTKRLKDNIEVTVTDNGGGIPQSVIDKVFQPFFTTKPTGQGTGLGLSLSYDIVKAHGGELKVESTEGEGAIFTILLPLT